MDVITNAMTTVRSVDVTEDVLADLGLDNLTEGRRVYQTDGQIILGTENPNIRTEIEDTTIEEAIIVTDNSVEQQSVEVPAEIPSTEEIIKIIPENPKLYEIDDAVSRFSSATWFEEVKKSSIILAGLGGIGSYVLFLLSRMHPAQIYIYDDDIVERANLSGQLYGKTMINMTKVNAMCELATEFSDYRSIYAIPFKWTSDSAPGDIMICGFDNMVARRIFFDSWVKHLWDHEDRSKCLFIDGRLSAEEFQVYCIKGDDKYNIERYHNDCLFLDSAAESVVCSYKQTSFCANMIGSIIVNLFTNFMANTLHPVIERDLPFKTYYDASMMYFKTEL